MLNKRLGCGQSKSSPPRRPRRDARHNRESFSADAGVQKEGAGGRPFLPTQAQPKGKASAFLPHSRLFGQESRLLGSLGYCVTRARRGERHLPCSGEPTHQHSSRAGAEPCRSSVSPTVISNRFADRHFWKTSSIPLSHQIFWFKRSFIGKIPCSGSCYLAAAIKRCRRILLG